MTNHDLNHLAAELVAKVKALEILDDFMPPFDVAEGTFLRYEGKFLVSSNGAWVYWDPAHDANQLRIVEDALIEKFGSIRMRRKKYQSCFGVGDELPWYIKDTMGEAILECVRQVMERKHG